MQIVRDTPQTTPSNIIKTDHELKNDFCRIQYDKNSTEIRGADLTDRNNDPRFYTQTKRGVAESWELLSQEFNEQTKFSDARKIIEFKNVRVHSYCAMD
jgi:hypothetical protein